MANTRLDVISNVKIRLDNTSTTSLFNDECLDKYPPDIERADCDTAFLVVVTCLARHAYRRLLPAQYEACILQGTYALCASLALGLAVLVGLGSYSDLWEPSAFLFP